MSPSPVVSLNRAVAVSMVEGPQVGIQMLDELAVDERLRSYHLLHAARAELLRQNGDLEAAANCYVLAMKYACNPTERKFLETRLRKVGG